MTHKPVPKPASYHRSAIILNEEIRNFARELSKRLEDGRVAHIAREIANEHHEYLKRHRIALKRAEKLEAVQTSVPETDFEAVVGTITEIVEATPELGIEKYAEDLTMVTNPEEITLTFPPIESAEVNTEITEAE